MHDISSICYALGAALGIASFWVPKLEGPAIAAIGMGLLLIGR